ncbi:MAG: ATPase P [Desulforegulaceae bacterium]|nr:ATPase P [Desulforegulaceae bacterium]
MIKISIPGFKNIEIKNILLDYNGTIATDGIPINGIIEKFEIISKSAKIHVITADTHGTVQKKLKNYNCEIVVISGKNQDVLKLEYLEKIGKNHSAAIGNGLNDRLMIQNAALGIAVLGIEGAHSKTILNSDLIVSSANDALDLFIKTNRLIAGLRNE